MNKKNKLNTFFNKKESKNKKNQTLFQKPRATSKTIKQALSKSKMIIPKTSQQMVACFFKEFDEDTGVFRLDDSNTYSIELEYTDISFSKAQQETIESIFSNWVGYLNSLPEKVTVKIVDTSKPLEKENFQKDFMIKDNVNYQLYVNEFNKLIKNSVNKNINSVVETRKSITISKTFKNFEEANATFINLQIKTEEKFKILKSHIRRVSTLERLEFIHNFLNKNDQTYLVNYIEKAQKLNLSIYDVLAPKSIDFRYYDFAVIDNRFFKVLYVSKLPNSMTPVFYNSLTTMQDIDLITTLNITGTNSGKAINKINKKLTSMRAERYVKVRRASRQGISYEYVKDEKLEENIADAEQLKYDFQKNDQKIFDTSFMVCVQANTYDELVKNVNRVIDLASENLIRIDPLYWRQLEGLIHILPLGHNTLPIQRSLTSEAAAVNVPFNTKDLMHKNALFYGMNQISKNGVFADRRLLLNGNGCVLATSGAGKSFIIKMLISQIFLKYKKDNVIILDLNGEYSPVVDVFSGQTVKISANSATKINPLDYDSSLDFDDRGALSNKIEYMIAFCESVAGDASATLKSIIDRCVRAVLRDATISKPKLIDFYDCLQKQQETEAQTLATVLERYVLGSVNTFAHNTNVNLHNRLVNFDLSGLEESMMKTGYLVVLEHIMQTIAKNKELGIDTHIFIDEFHILLETEYTAAYIAKIYKTIRKFFGFPTIITQNIEEVLSNSHGRKILGNSEFAVILKQNATDLKLISSIFNISPHEEEYITASSSGEGLIYYGGDIIPFKNTVSKDTPLYKMCQTSERVTS